jgi:hypothetical protein
VRFLGALLLLVGCTKPSAGPTVVVDAGAPVPPAASAATVAPPSALPSPSASSDAATGPTASLRIGGDIFFDYSTTYLRAHVAPGAITLTSSIFEDYNGGHFPFSIELRIVDRGVVQEARKSVPDGIFATNDESSFEEQPGFADRKTTSGGFHGYAVTMGVEGIGEVETFFPLSPAQTLHVTCHYCCGLTEKPKLTMDEQLAACDAVVQSLRRITPSP